ncbi:MAG TPA: Ig-like domain-containing protein, partial [Symbiobacteriaceae bacterium]|nr:Ig-like domain-containing protein [Symbiobacteriaceae bacterium]
VSVDGVAPKVSLTSPKAGAAVGDTVTVTASASDNKGVTWVEFYVDGDLAGTDTLAPWAFSWLTAGLPAGSHTLQAIAYDAAGNQAVSLPVTVRIDREPPSVRLTGLTEGDLLGRDYAVTIEATDDAGIVKAEFYVDGSVKGTATQEPFAWSLPASISSGSHTIRVKVTDAAGHTALSDPVAVVVDTALPTLTVSGLPSSATGVVTATVTATDNRGVDRVEVYIDGRMEYTLTDRTWVWDTAAFANGAHTVTFKAYDQAGNVTVKSLTVTVRN